MSRHIVSRVLSWRCIFRVSLLTWGAEHSPCCEHASLGDWSDSPLDWLQIERNIYSSLHHGLFSRIRSLPDSSLGIGDSKSLRWCISIGETHSTFFKCLLLVYSWYDWQRVRVLWAWWDAMRSDLYFLCQNFLRNIFQTGKSFITYRALAIGFYCFLC